MGIRFYISSIAMVAIILTVLLWQTISEHLEPWLFFFIYSIPSNLAISLFPHEPVLIYLAKTGSVIPLTITGTVGTIIAGILDYYVFVPLITPSVKRNMLNVSFINRTIRWFNIQPFLTLSIAGFTPIPFSPFKYLAFSSNYPLLKYLGSLVVGRAPRYYLLALTGEMFSIPDWVIVSAFIVMIAFIAYKSIPELIYLWRRNSSQKSSTDS